MAFAALFFGMSVCVATQSPGGLSRSVSILLLIQHLAVVGKLASQQVPASLTWVAELFTVLSMLNFDLQFVKPGCVVSDLSFLTVYWSTYGLVALSSLMFVAAALIRANPWLSSRSNNVPQAMEMSTRAASSSSSTTSVTSTAASTPISPRRQMQWRWRFKVRLTHAMLILCSVLYLRLSILTMEALQCTRVQLVNDGPLVSVLSMDLTTRCYEGGHLVTVIMLVYPTLIFFCLGFPLLSAWLLYTSFHRAARKAVRESSRSVQDSVSPNELSTNGHIPSMQLQKEQSVNQVWLSSSSGCTSPIAVSAPSTPLGNRRSQFDPTRHNRPLLVIGQSRSGRVHPAVSRSSTSPRSVSSAAGYKPPSNRSSSTTSSGRPLTPTVFSSWSPAPSLGRLAEQEPMSAPVAGKQEAMKSPAKVAAPVPTVALSPIQSALRQLGADWARQEQFGYLFRQLKGECYYFRLLFLFTSFGFASASVLPTSPTLRLFLTGVFFLADQLIVLVFTPFELPWRNLLSAGLSLVGVIQCMVMLALVQLGLSDGTSTQLNLGHSTSGQAATANPSNALIGVSYIAAYYELVLGMVWMASAVIVVIVHRRYILDTARSLAGALEEWYRPRQAMTSSRGHKRLESNSWQQPDCSAAPRSPVSVELTHNRAFTLPDAFTSSSRQHSAALDDVPESADAEPKTTRQTSEAANRTRAAVQRESVIGADTSGEQPPNERHESNNSVEGEDDEDDESARSPGLLSSLTTPLASAMPLPPTVPPIISAPDRSPGRSASPVVARSLPPVHVHRLPLIPPPSAPSDERSTVHAAVPLAARLPGAVETPAGSRRQSQLY